MESIRSKSRHRFSTTCARWMADRLPMWAGCLTANMLTYRARNTASMGLHGKTAGPTRDTAWPSRVRRPVLLSA